MGGKWSSSGSGLPFVDLNQEIPPEAIMEGLTEDLYRLTSPDGRYILDVSFTPEWDPDGVFRCVLIQDNDWDRPLREKEFRNTEEVVCWIVDETERVYNTVYGGGK